MGSGQRHGPRVARNPSISSVEEAQRIGWLRGRHTPVPNTGHYVHLEDPDATMTAIAPFAAEVDG